MSYQSIKQVSYFEAANDGYLMTGCAIKDAQQQLRQQGRKKALQQLSRLHNVAIIEKGGVVLTAYRADKKRIRRLRAGHVEAA